MNFIEHVREPRRLMLVWQGPEGSSRTRHTVGVLTRSSNGLVQLQYQADTPDFAAARNEGFINFPAFRKVQQTYALGVLETFMRRLPPRKRGDYAEYLERFGLRPQTPISDFALLAATGAKLPSDGFSLIDPLDDAAEHCEVILEVAGARYAPGMQQRTVDISTPVYFQPEPENPRDRNAVGVYIRGARFGYVPRQQAPSVAGLVESGRIQARVTRLNGNPQRPMIYLFTVISATTAHRPEDGLLRQE